MARPGRPPTPGPGDLDARLAAAIERLAVAERALRQSQATALGLSPIQLQLLTLVASAPASRRRVGALARELGVTQPTVSDAVAALVAKGLVRRLPDPADRRGPVLAPTAAGRRLAERARGLDATLAERLADLDAEAKATALAVLLECIAALVHEGVITVARCCTTCRHLRRDGAGGLHCELLGEPLPAPALRVDCPDHEPALPLSSSVGGS
jgi:DNA-binding MarR family transcriptional regulator